MNQSTLLSYKLLPSYSLCCNASQWHYVLHLLRRFSPCVQVGAQSHFTIVNDLGLYELWCILHCVSLYVQVECSASGMGADDSIWWHVRFIYIPCVSLYVQVAMQCQWKWATFLRPQSVSLQWCTSMMLKMLLVNTLSQSQVSNTYFIDILSYFNISQIQWCISMMLRMLLVNMPSPYQVNTAHASYYHNTLDTIIIIASQRMRILIRCCWATHMTNDTLWVVLWCLCLFGLATICYSDQTGCADNCRLTTVYCHRCSTLMHICVFACCCIPFWLWWNI